MRVELVGDRYVVSAAGSRVGEAIVPPTSIEVLYPPGEIASWAEEALYEVGGTGIITRTILRSGEEYVLIRECEWIPDGESSPKSAWEEVFKITPDEAAKYLDWQLLETYRLEDTKLRVRSRVCGYEVVTPRGRNRGKSYPADSFLFLRKPKVLRSWVKDSDNYILISDGLQHSLYICCRVPELDHECHALYPISPSSSNSITE